MRDKLHIPLTPNQLVQACTFHVGVVKDVKDPQGRGRVRVECSALLGVGKENWTNWSELCQAFQGGREQDGDQGMIWPAMPGQSVLVGFKGGDYNNPIILPGPPFKSEPKKDKKEMIPGDVKKVMDEDLRKGTRIRQIKSEAGHTIHMDDNGQRESMFLVDWTGAGIFWDSPGKEEDEQEKEGEESKPRKNKERREVRTVAAGTNKKPEEILKDGEQVIRIGDLNGSGITMRAKSGGESQLVISAGNPDEGAPSILLDSKNKNIVLEVNGTQFQLRGEKGDIKVTKQVIQEAEPMDTKPFFTYLKEKLVDRFLGYDKNNDGTWPGNDDSGGSETV